MLHLLRFSTFSAFARFAYLSIRVPSLNPVPGKNSFSRFFDILKESMQGQAVNSSTGLRSNCIDLNESVHERIC